VVNSLHNMDDWKLKARTSVKLEKEIDMFVSSFRILFFFLFIILPLHYSNCVAAWLSGNALGLDQRSQWRSNLARGER